jgi:hypothetical protein
MTPLRCHVAAWLLRLTLWCLPDHPYKRAMAAAMAEHDRLWWAQWRGEMGR